MWLIDVKGMDLAQPIWLSGCPIHGGLYRWRENSLPIFLFQKLKEILTWYSRTMVKVTIPGPELQSQNRVDVSYEKTFGLGA